MTLVRMFAILALLLALPSAGHAQPLQDQPTPSTATRIGVESGVTVAAAGVSIGGGFWAAINAARRCSDRADDFGFLGCGVRGGAVLMGVTFGTMPVLLTLGSYIPHRSLGGRGKWYAAFAGGATGLASGIGVFAIALSDKNISDAGLVTGVVAAALVASSVPVLALELSHKRQHSFDQRTVSKRRVIPVATALPGGGWLGVSGTL